VGLEHIVGFKKEGKFLRIEPKIPSSWTSFSIEYRYIDTLYTIYVQCDKGKDKTLIVDGKAVEGQVIALENDKKHHIVEVRC
jgi:cyclic beta-1,2-glucan synthetase